MTDLFLSENFADNGEHSHYNLIDSMGNIIIEDIETIRDENVILRSYFDNVIKWTETIGVRPVSPQNIKRAIQNIINGA